MTLSLPMLRPDQARIAKHPAKVKVLACGRRWGKTVLGGRIVMETLRQHGRAAWIAPTYKNTRPLWRWCVQVASAGATAYRVILRAHDHDRQRRVPGPVLRRQHRQHPR